MKTLRCVFATLALAASGAALAFTDLAQSRYAQAVVYLSGRGAVNGYPDGSFRPDETVTRAELTAVVMRLAGMNIERAQARPCFDDLSAGDWSAPYVCTAKAQGVVSGEGEGGFHPDQPVSYAEAAKIALQGLLAGFVPFEAGPWYLPYLDYAEAKGLYGDEIYTPDTPLTRGVMAKLLYETLALRPGSNMPPLTFPSGHYSEGCGTPPATPLGSVVVDGQTREIITALPDSYRSDHPYALVIAFHGRTSPASEVRGYFELEQHADDTIFVYPSGLPRGGGSFSWSDPGDPAGALRDYALFDTLLSTFKTRYCLDTRRVFLVGHSLGAHFANSLACARGHVIRAVGTLGGGVSPSSCEGRVAAMVLHNPEDRLVPVSRGAAVRDLFLRMNGLAGLPGGPVPAEPQSLNCQRYGPQGVAHPVLWCPHNDDYSYGGRYYPHNWPKEAGRAIMDFFASLP